jgi:SHS2 domain-containing protein
MMDSNKFEYFDVTADIGIRAWGNTINELFENAAIAVTSLIIDPNNIEKKIQKDIQVHGNDLSSLLINWITELLILRDSEGILFSSLKVEISKDKKSLRVKALGNNAFSVKFEMDIKAITYSLFELEKKNGGYYLQFVLDI